jgi:Cdc6-like AAA superfamily ATPase
MWVHMILYSYKQQTLLRKLRYKTMKDMNKVLAELKQYNQMKKELEAEISKLQDECKEYMTENELSELFNDDKSIVARYTEVISNRFDTTAFKKSEWSELYQEYSKKITSMRFTLE